MVVRSNSRDYPEIFKRPDNRCRVRLSTEFNGTLDTLLDTLNNIRLATILEDSKTPGAVKAIYKLEEMSATENTLMEALEIKDLHKGRLKINGVGVYN